MNSENNENSMITLRGFVAEENDEDAENKASQYHFNNCLITYRDGNGNPDDDVITYNNKGTPIIAMPKGYFICPLDGTHAKIKNCTFYNNRNVYPSNTVEGFVKDSLIDNCTIEETLFDQKLVITDNDAI